MRRNDSSSIVIVTRKKVVHAEAHGGAWKVAYADFVTAMMAFFLLLWLLNAVSQSQVSGVAEFFAEGEPTNNENVVTDDPGSEELFGQSRSTQPLQFDVANPTVLKMLKIPQNIELGNAARQAETTLRIDQENIDVVEEAEREVSRNFQEGIPTILEASDSMSESKNTMLIESRDNGLNVNIASSSGVFFPDTADLNLEGERQLAQILTLLVSRYHGVKLVIEGHSSRKENLNLWGLSLDRGFAAMNWLVNNDFDPKSVLSVDAYAAKYLLDQDKPDSPLNDRVVLKFIDFNSVDGALR